MTTGEFDPFNVYSITLTPVSIFDNFGDMDIKRDLQCYLEIKGEAPQELAQKSGVHFTTIYRILTGQYDPRLSTLEKLWPFLYGEQSRTQTTEQIETNNPSP